MKNRTALAIITAITTCAQAFAEDCNSILKVSLERLEHTSELHLDKAALNYYASDSFSKDYRNRKFSGTVIVEGIPLGMNASDEQLKVWQESIRSLGTSKLSIQSRTYYMETRGLSTLADAWLACHQGKLKLKAKIQESGSEAVVSFEFPTPGVKATINDVFTSGCTQERPGIFAKHPIRKGLEFDSSGLTAKFTKTKGSPNPIVVVQTSIGTGVAVLSSWPPPPPAPEPTTEPFSEAIVTDGQVDFTFPHTRGDAGNYAGNQVQMSVSLRVELRKEPNGGISVYYVGEGKYEETGPDHTTYSGPIAKHIKTFPDATSAELVPSNPNGALNWTEAPNRDGRHKQFSIGHPGAPASNLVSRWDVYHDTGRVVIHVKQVTIQGKRKKGAEQ